MRKLHVTVNHHRCVGSQLCMQFSPGVFELNANGQSSVVDVEKDSVENIIATAEQCPQCAIRVEDMETFETLFPPPELDY
ncbi:MAG: ferredoxin [Bacteriodetes bacterium]|nr:ferredoxin [Bacteroidota bacterium]